MASYQEIESRLRSVEDLLKFMASNIRVKYAVASPVLGPNGRPQGEIRTGTMLDLYFLSRQYPLEHVEGADKAPEADADQALS